MIAVAAVAVLWHLSRVPFTLSDEVFKSHFEVEPRQAAAALVSVIIPFSKFRRHTLLQATHSALNQSYPNVEVILVDSSEDPRAKELDEMTFQGKVIVKHLPSIEGNFAGYNRNEGALLASGEFLAFFDSFSGARGKALMKVLSTYH